VVASLTTQAEICLSVAVTVGSGQTPQRCSIDELALECAEQAQKGLRTHNLPCSATAPGPEPDAALVSYRVAVNPRFSSDSRSARSAFSQAPVTLPLS